MNVSSSITREISERLSTVRKKQLLVDLQSQACLFLTIAILLFAAIAFVELVFHFPSGIRTALVLLFVVVSFVSFLWFFARPLLRVSRLLPSWDDFLIARRVGDFFPNIRDRLLNLLQLRLEAQHGTRYSLELIDASFQDLAETIRPVDFLQSVSIAPARRSLRNLSVVAIVVLLPVISSPGGFINSIQRLIRYDKEFVRSSRYAFRVIPGNKEVIKGDRVAVSVTVSEAENSASRILSDPLHLKWKVEDQLDFQEVLLRPDSQGTFRTTLENVRLSTDYYADFQGTESEHFRLTVLDRPVLRSIQVRLDYPSYTKLPPKLQDEFIGDVSALPGTQVTITGLASKDLRSGALVFTSGSKVPLTLRAQRFTSRFPLLAETDYHIEITDGQGLQNLDPIAYHLKIVSDEHPTVSILEPGRNLDVAGATALPLLLQAKDDFGVSRLRIAYRLVQSRYEPVWEHPRFVDIPLPRETSLQKEIRYSWDLSRLKLVPEDVLEYFAEVFDNDAVRGPKAGRSPLYLLRLPSLEEVFTDLDVAHEDAVQDLKQAVEETKQLKEKLESVNQDLKKNKDIDWQQHKKMEETARRYEKLQQKLDQVHATLDTMLQQMQQQQVLSTETMEKYLQLQELFEQLSSEELSKAFSRMQQAMQSLNREQFQQALQQIQFSEERFRQTIERTLNLLKRIQIEQKLDELRKRAEELADEQRQLEQEAARTENTSGKHEELAKKQDDLRKKLGQLQEKSADVQNRMEEFFTEMPADKLNELNRRLEQQQPGEKMNQAAHQLRGGQTQRAREAQQEVQRQLQNFADQVDALQQQMLQQQAEQAMSELRKAVESLLELSKREEALKEQSKIAPQNSPQLRQNAQDQMRVSQELGNVVRSLSELSQKSFAVTLEMGKAIGEALAKMQSALRALDFRSGGMASQEQGSAMAALNKAAVSVQNALQAMMQQGSGMGGGLLGQLQSLAGQQMSLNMKTQSMEDAARLAVEQEAIRKSLEQLNKEAQTRGDQERLLGDLERIAEEMQEVTKNLEQNNINPETMRKQERILSRLLDASRSTRERDFEKKRKAQTGTQVARRTPRELDPKTLEGRSRLREDLLRAIEQRYSKDYHELIRKYFEELQKIDE